MVSGIITNNFFAWGRATLLNDLGPRFSMGYQGEKKKPQASWKTTTQYPVESKLVLIYFIWKERLVFMQMNTWFI